jgi:ABC-type molybdate transport system substrate-binding protein
MISIKMNMILKDTRINFAGNKLSWWSRKCRFHLTSFHDLKKQNQENAIGNPKPFPAGRYAEEISETI